MYKITDLWLRACSDNTQVGIHEKWFCLSDVNVKDESQLPFTSFGKEEREKKDSEENEERNAIPSAKTDEKSVSSNLVRRKMKILSA